MRESRAPIHFPPFSIHPSDIAKKEREEATTSEADGDETARHDKKSPNDNCKETLAQSLDQRCNAFSPFLFFF